MSSRLNFNRMSPEKFKELLRDLTERNEKADVYANHDPEARAYFESLDQIYEKYKALTYFCDNCGNPLLEKDSPYHKLSKSKKCSTEMARRMAMSPDDIPDDEWKLLEEAYQASLRREAKAPKAFLIPKPSWFQRLLDWLS